MAVNLRGYQQRLKDGIYRAWQQPDVQCVIGVTATGGGKTVTMAAMASELPGTGVIEAHRSELVGQISKSLAREGIQHNIVASKKRIKMLAEEHLDIFGRNYYNPRARWTVASVDTIIKRESDLYANVNYLFQDEGHHTLQANKWGRAAGMHPNAKVALFTATPCRADGKGLGRHADGIADAIVIGPGLRELIDDAYLTDYTIAAPKVEDLDLRDVHITQGGDYNKEELARAIKRSNKLVGSVVDEYIKLALGKRAVCFASDVEEGQKYADAFKAKGVPAAFVDGTSSDVYRDQCVKDLAAGVIHVLVNVDLFGEGFDLPAIEVVIMARPTASFPLFAQQVGRALRLMIDPTLMEKWDTFHVEQRKAHIAASKKPRALVIDHVGNFYREFKIGEMTYSGPPDGFMSWTLEGRTKRRSKASDGIPLRTCLNSICGLPYERIYSACPHCGTPAPEPAGRGSPQQVDGDLLLLDPAVWGRNVAEIARITGPALIPRGVTPVVAAAIGRAHDEKKAAHYRMKEIIAHWAGRHPGDADSVNYRRFFFKFGVDVHSALTLSTNDSIALYNLIAKDMQS